MRFTKVTKQACFATAAAALFGVFTSAAYADGTLSALPDDTAADEAAASADSQSFKVASNAAHAAAAEAAETSEETRNSTIERASGEKLSAAVGHYARARSLLIAAVREFDQGYEIARPDALLDSKQFRSTLVQRAKDLEKVLDPQPRVSQGGVRYEPDTRLLGESDKTN